MIVSAIVSPTGGNAPIRVNSHSHSHKRRRRDAESQASEGASCCSRISSIMSSSTARSIQRPGGEEGATPLLLPELRLTPKRTRTRAMGSWRGPLSRNPSSTRPAHNNLNPEARRPTLVLLLLSCYWLLLLSCSVPAVAAAGIPDPTPSELVVTQSTTSAISAITASVGNGIVDEKEEELEVLLIETRAPLFVNEHWQIMADEHREIRRRGSDTNEGQLSDITMRNDMARDASTTTADANPSTSQTTAKPLPSPFDGGFTFSDKGCFDFIENFLSNETFKACYPISLLLQSSQSFFTAEKSRLGITQVLDTACAANVAMCTSYFDKLADKLVSRSACGKEYDEKDTLVMQAHQGMKAYQTVYKATCLLDKDATSPDYCFTVAITNATTPSNSYLYFLPLNETLPSTAAPSCNSCTQQTMQIYQAATSNSKADIVNTYPDAAKQINEVCGDGFVDTALSATVPSAASVATVSPFPFLAAFALMAVSRWVS